MILCWAVVFATFHEVKVKWKHRGGNYIYWSWLQNLPSGPPCFFLVHWMYFWFLLINWSSYWKAAEKCKNFCAAFENVLPVHRIYWSRWNHFKTLLERYYPTVLKKSPIRIITPICFRLRKMANDLLIFFQKIWTLSRDPNFLKGKWHEIFSLTIPFSLWRWHVT